MTNPRITIVPMRDRYTFLIDGRGDAVFDKTWGITTFATPELARKAAEEYLSRMPHRNASGDGSSAPSETR